MDKIEEISTKDLKVDEFNVRKGRWETNDSTDELVRSIKELGIKYPLLVRPAGKGQGCKYTIVCGSRRWNAAKEAKLKVVPCVVQQLSDKEALALSFQENRMRDNLTMFETAEAIALFWDIENGSKPYEEKIKSLEKQLNLEERKITELLSVSRLAESIKNKLETGKIILPDSKLLSGVEAGWEKSKDQTEAVEILEDVYEREGGAKARKVLSEMKTYPELSPAEAYEKVKGIAQGRYYSVYLNNKICKALDRALVKEKLDAPAFIEKAITSELKREKFL